MGRVAAVVITRDDARGIERALLSAKPYVDELLVFDLGSVDDTVARAERCGARVERGTWRADTSAIRNDALALTDATWRLVLEAGEWIDGGGAGLSALRETSTEHVGLVSVIPGDASRGLSPVSLAERLLPAGVRFVGRRPEEPVIDGLRQLRTGVVLASDEGEQARWRHDRTAAEAVLLQGLSVRPGDPGMLAELAGILRAEGRLVEAHEAYSEALARIDPSNPDTTNSSSRRSTPPERPAASRRRSRSWTPTWPRGGSRRTSPTSSVTSSSRSCSSSRATRRSSRRWR